MSNILINTYNKEGLNAVIEELNFLSQIPKKSDPKISSKEIIELINAIAERGGNINTVAEGPDCYCCGGIPHATSSPIVLKAFVEAGGDINLFDEEFTPLGRYLYGLHYVHYTKIPEEDLLYQVKTEDLLYRVKTFLDLGADPNVLDKNGTSLIFQATKLQPYVEEKAPAYNSLVTKLIDLAVQYGGNVNQPDKEGRTPLYFAKTPEVISKLLDYGADPNYKPPETPLRNAFEGLNYEKTKMLLEAGADISRENLGKDKKYPTILFTLLNGVINEQELSVPTAESIENAAKLTKLAHELGTDLETINRNGETVFAYACRLWSLDCDYSDEDDVRAIQSDESHELYNKCLCPFLIALAELGADINVADKDGEPAIGRLPKDLQTKLKQISYNRTVKQTEEFDMDCYER